MDIFEDSYYKLNRLCLSMVGLWPFGDKRTTFFTGVIAKICLVLILTSQMSKIVINRSLDNITDVCMFFLPCLAITEGYHAFYSNNHKIKEILEHIMYDWRTLGDGGGREMGIMQEHAEESRTFTVILAVIHYLSMYVLILQSILPAVLDIIVPLNETRPRELPIPAEIFFDYEKYFFSTMLLAFFVATILGTISMAVFPLIVIFMKHICGLFQITGYIFEHIIDEVEENRTYDTERIYARVVHGMKYHKKAINFTNMVNSFFEWSLFVQVAITFAMLAIEIFHIMNLDADKQNFNEMAIYVFYVIAVLVFVLAIGYMGQLVIDCSGDIFDKAYATSWYLYPPKVRRLFVMVMLRSMKPCQITVGNVSSLSHELLISIVELLMTPYRNVAYMIKCSMYIIPTAGTINAYNAINSKSKAFADVWIDMADFWTKLETEDEIRIIEDFVREGRNYTVTLIVFVILLFLAGGVQNMFPLFLDIFVPLNGTRSHKLAAPIYIPIDVEKYYVLIYLAFMVWAVMFMLMVSSAQSMSMIASEHICACLSIVGHVLTAASKDAKASDVDEKVIRGIQLHKKTLQYLDMVNQNWEHSYLIQVGFAALLTILDVIHVFNLQTLFEESLSETITSLIYVITTMLYILIAFYIGQKVLNASSKFYDVLCTLPWYDFPVKTQKLFILIILKSKKDCYLSVGKTYKISYELYSSFLEIFWTSKENLSTLIESFMYMLPMLCSTNGYMSLDAINKEVALLFIQIQEFWAILETKDEICILEEGAKKTRIYTVTLLTSVNALGFLLIIQNMFPFFLDIFMPLNETRSYKIVLPIYVPFDEENNFLLVYFVFSVCTLVFGMLLVCTYSTMILSSMHINASLDVIGYILITAFETSEGTDIEKKLIRGIKLHKKALQLILDLQSASKNSLNKTIISLGYIITTMIYILIAYSVSQMMLNGSTKFYNTICTLPWYKCPIRTQKMLIFMIARSKRNCYLSVGKTYKISYELFASVK
ncbi:hypothetical protein KPH14_007910 [Odynerus spinipes]|uniref:Odorant receptor n=1 Tax=Odynerus spinipes TaxID=1348599 RepID=A0AAD9VWB5_9HYME|nr:hypothetical protein KPH14_007910 [Odynerus spinipes]